MAKVNPPAHRLPMPARLIDRRIYVIRGQKVMLDSDLSELYQVETKALNRAVKRNPDRFPADFMFQLTTEESRNLRFQIGTSSSAYGGRRYLPYAFTEHGVAMLSAVLNSDRAIQMSIRIVRAFVKLRDLLAGNKELARKVERLAVTQRQHAVALIGVISEIKQLKAPPKRKPRIGFYTGDK
jgi:phage regulator Rha-like protein